MRQHQESRQESMHDPSLLFRHVRHPQSRRVPAEADARGCRMHKKMGSRRRAIADRREGGAGSFLLHDDLSW
jgi:hypothetical protein